MLYFSQSQHTQSREFKELLDNALHFSSGLVLNSPVRNTELDSMILMGFFQLKIFYDSKMTADSHFFNGISALRAPKYCSSPRQHQWAVLTSCPMGGVTQLLCLFCRLQLVFHHWPAHRASCSFLCHRVNMSCSSSRLETHHA